MRKAIFTLILFCTVLSSETFAQTGFHAGLITGYNNTWVIAQEQYDGNRYRYKAAFASAPFGLSVGYKFNPNHGVMIEAFRSNIEGKYELLADNGTVSGEKIIELKYWSVPLLFKFTSSGEKARFNFQLGPQLSFLSEGLEYNDISREANFRRPGRNDRTFTPGRYEISNSETEGPNSISTFNNVDVGVVAGLGAEIVLTESLYLSTNFRINYNFRNVFNEESIQHPDDIDTYTLRNTGLAGIQIGLHYFLSDQNRPARDAFEGY